MWSQDAVFWGRGGRKGALEGQRKDQIIDFREQIGVYVLYDEGRHPVYVGQAGQGNARLFKRLRSHRRDHLADRQMRYWLNLFDENRWNGVNKASRIMPADSSAVLIQAARHSNELWTEVRDAFRLVTNADYQIERYYAQDQPAYRQGNLITLAHSNLKNAESKLTHIFGVFTVFEETERKRQGSGLN